MILNILIYFETGTVFNVVILTTAEKKLSHVVELEFSISDLFKMILIVPISINDIIIG